MQFRVIVVTDTQTGAITIHCAAASLARSVIMNVKQKLNSCPLHQSTARGRGPRGPRAYGDEVHGLTAGMGPRIWGNRSQQLRGHCFYMDCRLCVSSTVWRLMMSNSCLMFLEFLIVDVFFLILMQ